MKFIEEIWLFIQVLTSPAYWLMTEGTYSKAFDKWCRTVMRNSGTFEEFDDGYRATLCGKVFWVENHHYASFTYKGLRPSRRTKILLRNLYEKSIVAAGGYA